MYDIIIIGAGASGLVSAIVSARRGKRVLILEKNNKIGKKILATGNGKCNITNQRPTKERFYSNNPKFIGQVLEGYNYQSIKQFFRSIGLELIEGKEGKVFPMSLQASSVVELLSAECNELGVKIVCDTEVQDVNNLGKSGYKKVIHTHGFEKAKAVVFATGHLSAPQLGGVELGITLAKKLGHRAINPFPTLVQLTSSMKNLKRMAGVKVDSRVTLKTKRGKTINKQGDVLFTSYGVSGLAILDISRFVMQELIYSKTTTLDIDLMPKMTKEQLFSLMKKTLNKKSNKPIDIWLQGFINKKLILPILESLKLQNKTVDSITSNEIKLVINKIKSFKIQIDGSRGYKGAEVVAGGIDTKEVDPKTMESKKHKGLYFTGEILDVDGDRGGFNLHFAWVCGLKVGENI